MISLMPKNQTSKTCKKSTLPRLVSKKIYKKHFGLHTFYFVYTSEMKMTHNAAKTEANYVGPCGVRVLPMAAGINVGGHHKWHFFLLFLSFFLSSGSLLFLPEGVVVGFCNFAWAPK